MKKALFITTKNLDYIRNIQEIYLLEKDYTLTIVGSNDKKYIKRLLKVYRILLFKSVKEYDLIFVGFAPQLVLPFFSHKFKNKEIVMDFFISVYDTMIFDRKKFKQRGLIAKFCKWIDKKTFKHVDTIICDTNAHGDYFSCEFDIPREKFHTLYLNADENVYYPRPQKKPDELKNKFIVLYFGSILPLQGVDVILKMLESFVKDDRFYFYIIGPLKSEYKRVDSDNIEYIEWLSQAQLAEYIARADLCLAGHFNSEIGKAKRTIPGKAYIYKAMKKRMILGDNSATRELFSEGMEDIYFVKMGDSEALADKIRQIYDQISINDTDKN